MDGHNKAYRSRFDGATDLLAVGGPSEGAREGRVEESSDVRQPVIFGISGAVPSSPFLTGRQVFAQMGGNAGNLAFVYAIRQHLVGWGDPANLPWRALPAHLERSGDVCVIPCANQFGPRFDLDRLANRLAKVDMPLVAVGLGAQSGLNLQIPEVPDGTVRWLRTIATMPLATPPTSRCGETSHVAYLRPMVSRTSASQVAPASSSIPLRH